VHNPYEKNWRKLRTKKTEIREFTEVKGKDYPLKEKEEKKIQKRHCKKKPVPG
jgi:hypothetical protein